MLEIYFAKCGNVFLSLIGTVEFFETMVGTEFSEKFLKAQHFKF